MWKKTIAISTLISLLALNGSAFALGPTTKAIGNGVLVTGANALKTGCQLQKNPEAACSGGVMAGLMFTTLFWGAFSHWPRS